MQKGQPLCKLIALCRRDSVTYACAYAGQSTRLQKFLTPSLKKSSAPLARLHIEEVVLQGLRRGDAGFGAQVQGAPEQVVGRCWPLSRRGLPAELHQVEGLGIHTYEVGWFEIFLLWWIVVVMKWGGGSVSGSSSCSYRQGWRHARPT